MTGATSGAEKMPRPRVRPALALLLALGAVATAGCGLREKVRALVARPTPTPAPAPTPLPVPPLKMDFVRIHEERSRGAAGSSSCAIEIELGGAARSEIEAFRVVVRSAVDDLGTSLVPDAGPEPAPLPGGAADAPIVLPVRLKLASRKATSLREVSGEIELTVRGAGPAVPRPAPGTRTVGPNTLRRYRFALRDVPLP